MTLRLAILPGDGIGPEITTATRHVLERCDTLFDLGLSFEEISVGFDALAASGSTFPDSAFEAARACDGIVLGPVSHAAYPPRAEGGLNPSGELRTRLDLFANIRPARTRPGVPHAAVAPMDLVVMRENTEGFYADRNMHQGPGEMMPSPDMALAIRKVTRGASFRIAQASFEMARARLDAGFGPGRVTAVHKANVLRVSDGLFLDCVRDVAAAYPDIALDEVLIDAMCAHLVRDPGGHDVICTTNMYGDILSDLTSELAGGLGLAASLNAGADAAMAQAQHGSAPDLAGRDVANPASLIGSAAMLLRWLGERRGALRLANAATAIEAALEAALADPECRTVDLGGRLGTAAFAASVAERLAAE